MRLLLCSKINLKQCLYWPNTPRKKSEKRCTFYKFRGGRNLQRLFVVCASNKERVVVRCKSDFIALKVAELLCLTNKRRPSTSKDNDDIEAIKKMIYSNRKIKIYDIENELNITQWFSIFNHPTDVVNFQKT